jgi:hypothetical protein
LLTAPDGVLAAWRTFASSSRQVRRELNVEPIHREDKSSGRFT